MSLSAKGRKAKGARNEYKSRDIYRGLGYYVIKAGGSLGMWDLIGIGHDNVVFVQVKSNGWPPRKEMEVLTEFCKSMECESYAFMIHAWHDREKHPRIKLWDTFSKTWTEGGWK